jgi:tetratricopeptide (TPR) repeat protein
MNRSAFAAVCVWAMTLATPLAAAGVQDGGAGVLQPLRAGLEPIVLPPSNALEPAVAEQLRDAQVELQRAAEAGSNPQVLADAYGSLGQTFHVYEFFEAADAAYRNASQLTPNESRWLHLRGYLYQQSGRFQDAAAFYTAARRLRPEAHVLAIRLGEASLAMGRLDGARAEFEAASARFPASAQAGLGEVALRERKFDDAVRHFRAALARVPQATSLHYPLAMAYRGLGRVEEARAHLRQRGPAGIRAVDPVVDDLQTRVRGERALMIQGRRAFDGGRFEEAAEAFRRALDVAPGSMAARLNLGAAQAQLGQVDEAAAQFREVLSLDPANVTAHASLGLLLAGQGRVLDALDHLQLAFRQSPSDKSVSRALAGALVRLGRQEEAIGVLIEVRSLDPDDEATLVALAILLSHEERYGEAVSMLEEANRRWPAWEATATTLARLLASSPDVSLRDGTRALDLAMEVYAGEPAPVHAETVALALAELGRCADAVQWMRRAVAEAERAGDEAEGARLRGHVPKYALVSCRPPGR